MSEVQIRTGSVSKSMLDEKILDELRNSLRGELVTSKDDNYDKLRRVWNGLIEKYPRSARRRSTRLKHRR